MLTRLFSGIFASYSNIYERQRERVSEYVRERSCEQVCTLLRVRVCKGFMAGVANEQEQSECL